MIENLNISNKTNITLFIIYQQLNEFSIDGKINIQCVNLIQPNLFHLYHRDSGLIKLKLTVDKLNAYLHSIGRVKLCRHVNDEVTLKSIRAGDVECRNSIDEINIVLSGIGSVYYSDPLKTTN
ncbi:unnamed protein product [Rotaria sordida]|uniref:Putative auto-transporter adhesin head GIN domain-containing protein n=1 Tax=Rotaria sordida TaxID=392033 RepID=A0A813NZW1_9BILA|nr:unnamed protein product [Rotaria sordida]